MNNNNNEMQKNGYEPRPIINTEGGYLDTLHVPSDEITKQNVAKDIPKLHVIAFNKGVKAWLWLPFTERDDSYANYGLHWKGLIAQDQTELPAYSSYKTMVAKIDGFSLIEKVGGLGAGYVYKVSFPDKDPIYVIWDTTSKTVDLSSLISGNVKVTHVDGTGTVTSSQNVSVSDSPIYVEELPPGVSVQKQVDKTAAFPGNILTYTISYTNISPAEILNSRIEDPIPAGTTFISATNSGTSDGTKIIWNLGSLAPGAGGNVSFQVRLK